jgi:hypothetical protein
MVAACGKEEEAGREAGGARVVEGGMVEVRRSGRCWLRWEWEWGMWGMVRGGGSCRWGMISSKYFELASVGTWERAGGGFAGPEIRWAFRPIF